MKRKKKLKKSYLHANTHEQVPSLRKNTLLEDKYLLDYNQQKECFPLWRDNTTLWDLSWLEWSKHSQARDWQLLPHREKLSLSLNNKINFIERSEETKWFCLFKQKWNLYLIRKINKKDACLKLNYLCNCK